MFIFKNFKSSFGFIFFGETNVIFFTEFFFKFVGVKIIKKRPLRKLA